jgi:hypothetical protein
MNLYCAYYQRSRTHLSLQKDAPIPRLIVGPDAGRVVTIPQVGTVSPLRTAGGLTQFGLPIVEILRLPGMSSQRPRQPYSHLAHPALLKLSC